MSGEKEPPVVLWRDKKTGKIIYRKKNGRLILRDYTTKSKVLLWLCNHIEMPLAHLCGHGDVRLYSGAEFRKFAVTAGFEVVSFEAQDKMRAHLVARKK